MKTIYLALSLVFAFFLASCSSNSGDTTGGGIIGPGGGGGTGAVTFTVAVVQDPQTQGYYFEFKPSTGATMTKITANCPQAQVTNEVVTGDGTTVYTQTSPIYVGPLTILAQGQVWTFVIEGKVGSSTGAAYTSNATYTVQ